jgi:hypothetical protein
LHFWSQAEKKCSLCDFKDFSKYEKHFFSRCSFSCGPQCWLVRNLLLNWGNLINGLILEAVMKPFMGGGPPGAGGGPPMGAGPPPFVQSIIASKGSPFMGGGPPGAGFGMGMAGPPPFVQAMMASKGFPGVGGYGAPETPAEEDPLGPPAYIQVIGFLIAFIQIKTIVRFAVFNCCKSRTLCCVCETNRTSSLGSTINRSQKCCRRG